MSEDLRLSVSKTKTFNQCKKQYQFNYILKFPKKDRDYHIFGKFCHQVLEDFHQAYITGCLLPYNITMTDCFKKVFAEYRQKMTPTMKKDCWEIINKYLKIVSEAKQNNSITNVLAVEKKFELAVSENVILNGMIDRIQIDADDVVHVADYKTTKNKKYLKNDWFQLLTYAYVIMSEDPSVKKVRASYILLRHDFEYITTEFEADEIMKIKDKYLEYAQQILSEKEFAPTTSMLCAYCDFLNSCDEGMKKAQVFNGEVSW